MNIRNKKWFRALFRRRMFVIFLILLQICFFGFVIFFSSKQAKVVSVLLYAISYFVAVRIATKRDVGGYKLVWVFQILMFPIYGGLLYLLLHFQSSRQKVAHSLKNISDKTNDKFFICGDKLEQAKKIAPECVAQMKYLQNFAKFPVYLGTKTKYLSPGEVKFKYLLEELKKAEKYIFLEYFIIQEGIMWNEILAVLAQKAADGVDVRIIYDDMGCLFLLPTNFSKKLEALGIKCRVFNPFKPFLSSVQNNRDHRKIAVIDGKVAFTGGTNIADEYINSIEKYGHWKDSSIMLTGSGAWSFTVMFLQMWSLVDNNSEDISKYYPYKDALCSIEAEGIVQPYADSPMDKDNVGEHVYLQIINNAKDYVYINTPYLIVDDNILSALRLAAKSGVDVRIITPHKWDKFLVHLTTRSYYRDLINAGVKIYEYTIGFNHSKTFVSDDKVATVGTTNLDFRSLYLHFECGVWMYKTSAIEELKNDFLQTLKVCHRITEEHCKRNIFVRFIEDVIRLFAPLM